MMPINVRVEDDHAIVDGPFPIMFLKLLSGLAGRKVWLDKARVKFQAFPANLEKLKESDFEIHFDDVSGQMASLAEFEALASQHRSIQPNNAGSYTPAQSLFAHQRSCLDLCWERTSYGLLLEMGLGKSAILVANAGRLHTVGRLTGCLILSPKGVHRQWANEQIPGHIDPNTKHRIAVWKGKELNDSILRSHDGELVFLCMNIDAARTQKGHEVAERFLKHHYKSSMMAVDESHDIKSHDSNRTKAVIKLGRLATYRRILTGTPITNNILDAYSQLQFLDERISGHIYITTFKAEFCILAPGEFGMRVVGQKNTEKFYAKIAPHIFRLTKAEALDLPPKMYVRKEYEPSETVKRHYKTLRKTLMAEMEDGTIVEALNAAVALGKLQQVVNGWVKDDEGVIHDIDHDRLVFLIDMIDQLTGKIIIWVRFIEDANRVYQALALAYGYNRVVRYTGQENTSQRSASVQAFMKNKECRFFVSNPAAGGTGLNLQGECTTVIYYSNSFNAKDRWQSEDRVHRIGTTGAVTYFDIVAQGSVDDKVLRNLREKKSISDLTFDQIRQAIKESDL